MSLGYMTFCITNLFNYVFGVPGKGKLATPNIHTQ